MYLQRVRPSIERDGAVASVATLTHGPEDVQQRAAWASLGQPPASSLLSVSITRAGQLLSHVSPPRRPPTAVRTRGPAAWNNTQRTAVDGVIVTV